MGRVFGRDAALNGGAAQVDAILLKAQIGEGLASGDAQLCVDEIHVRDLFSDRVLDLNARVHLDEHVLPGTVALGVEEELDGAGVHVPDRFRKRDRVAVQRLGGLSIEVRGGRHFDHLLVSPLHRAVTLVEVHGPAVVIRKNLHLNVSRAQHGLLDEHSRITERGTGLVHGVFDCRAQVVAGFHAPHAAATATRGRLHKQRKTDVITGCDEGINVFGRLGRGQHGYARGDRMLLRDDLIARHVEHVGCRPNEGDAVLLGLSRKFWVLGQEAVTGVNGVGP